MCYALHPPLWGTVLSFTLPTGQTSVFGYAVVSQFVNRIDIVIGACGPLTFNVVRGSQEAVAALGSSEIGCKKQMGGLTTIQHVCLRRMEKMKQILVVDFTDYKDGLFLPPL